MTAGEADATLKNDVPQPRVDPYAEYEFPSSPDAAAAPDVELPYKDMPPKSLAALAPGTERDSSDVYFGVDPMGSMQESIAPWAPGEAPVVAELRRSGHQTIGAHAGDRRRKITVNRSPTRARSPARASGRCRRPSGWRLQRIRRAKAEKCLANAVYFEARDEPVRAQIAVAQVVLNRVFSPFYPNDVCGVVYQNASAIICLPVHLRLRRHSRRRHRTGRLGTRQAHRPRHARRQAVDAGSGQIDALSRRLGASELGRRDEEGWTSSAASSSTGRAHGATVPTSRIWGDAKTTADRRPPSYKTARQPQKRLNSAQ